MTRRTEKKLQEVPIARYMYRHDAEFAAGFLDDAGIPYRLQIDDPALGMSVGASATLWVLGMDERRAREVLDLDVRGLSSARAGSDHLASDAGEAARRARDPRGGRAPIQTRGDVPVPGGPTHLSLRERGVALILAGGLFGLGELFLSGADPSIVQVATDVLAAVFGIAGVVGRSPRVVRRWLGALSGNAP
ncbi:MAG: hypothetical protein AMS19_01745 [Gemmatimonas sp. SG8_23]|jgi:hypothetical protein|nr:MAG: hypothetical protein AMS19_01745 [Gemmatimonas sp. SG8_23]